MRHPPAFCCVVIVITALNFVTARAQLSGTYDIGSMPSDFLTISAAVDSLNDQGISGPVTFQIKAGTYDEQVTIQPFARTGNPDDELKFEPSGGAVTWQYSSPLISTNWVVKLVGISYVVFSDIDFVASQPAGILGRLILIDVNGTNISFSTVRSPVLPQSTRTTPRWSGSTSCPPATMC